MRRWIIPLLLLLALSACGTGEAPAAPAETVAEEPAPAPVLPAEEEPEPIPVYDADEVRLAMETGGRLVKLGDDVIASDGAHLVASDRETGETAAVPFSGAERIFFDGDYVYYASDDGIYRTDPASGETVRLSEDVTKFMRIDQRKLYYIKQTDPESYRPKGELWCMDKDGGGAVVILPGEVAGSFAIRSGWVYFISAEDGKLYRQMLFGSERSELASLPDAIVLVTDRYCYYSENDGGNTLRRVDLKSGGSVSLGAYGTAVRVGDKVYVASRQERSRVLDNQFSLSAADSSGEVRQLMVFENLGDDRLVYVWGDTVYLRRPGGGICALRMSDPEQEKRDILPAETVFVDGAAWYLDGSEIKMMECEEG